MGFIDDTEETLKELYDYAEKQRDAEKNLSVDKMKFTYQTWMLGRVKDVVGFIKKLNCKKR